MSKDLEVENYEHNLKMHYEAKRKELDIQLSSSMPTQMSTIKTILWINFLMIGLMLQMVKNFPMPKLMIGFFLLSLCAVLAILIAMLIGRTKSYGTVDDPSFISAYKDPKWEISEHIINMIWHVQYSININRKTIIKKSNLMHVAVWLTVSGMIFIILTFIQLHLKL